MELTGKRVLVAYFSRTGMNYTDAGIVDLPVGNTAVAAGILAELTGGDLFEIKAVHEYPFEYQACTEVAGVEKKSNARPALTAKVEGFEGYDVVFLGYPSWWGTCPMPVFTFLDSYDFSGKTLAPFCTNEGSGLGESVGDVKRAVPSAVVTRGLSLKGSRVKDSAGELRRWIEKL